MPPTTEYSSIHQHRYCRGSETLGRKVPESVNAHYLRARTSHSCQLYSKPQCGSLRPLKDNKPTFQEDITRYRKPNPRIRLQAPKARRSPIANRSIIKVRAWHHSFIGPYSHREARQHRRAGKDVATVCGVIRRPRALCIVSHYRCLRKVQQRRGRIHNRIGGERRECR